MNAATQSVSRPPPGTPDGGPFPPLEPHYRWAVQGLEEGVVFHDHDGVIRATNPSAERILRVTSNALVGRRSVLELCDPINEDGTPFSLENCPALVCLRTECSERDVIVGVRRSDEETRWLCFTSHPLTRADGVKTGVVTSFRDITELKDKERLSTTRYQEVSNTVRLHDAFLATAAHELRTPLTALKLQVQNLLRNATQGACLAAETLTQKLQGAVRQTERLNSLVDLLLDVSRMTVGRLELNRTRVDFAAVVADTLARQTEELSAAAVTVSLDAEPVIGSWDVARVEQVVGNLVSNAVKYGNRKPIHVSVRREGERVKLAVTDTGLGVPSSEHHRIFERFERAHDGGQSGMGLGLWIVREIADAHGGGVELTSEPNKGSTFTVWMPLSPDGTEPSQLERG